MITCGWGAFALATDQITNPFCLGVCAHGMGTDHGCPPHVLARGSPMTLSRGPTTMGLRKRWIQEKPTSNCHQLKAGAGKHGCPTSLGKGQLRREKNIAQIFLEKADKGPRNRGEKPHPPSSGLKKNIETITTHKVETQPVRDAILAEKTAVYAENCGNGLGITLVSEASAPKKKHC